MLPATLVTFTTFLLEICSSSPVYNMQPAFITNTVGSTAGRNIRNLPCISRRNSNQSGFCMFAIDCLKANGTHLGTCIDGFYFGSCCHVEPVRDIIDNTLDTDIIPHREPPYRISSTTLKPTKGTTLTPNETTTLKLSLNSTSTTVKSTTVESISTNSPMIQNISSTTISQKLQTFQIVQEVSTKPSTLSTKGSIEVISKPITKEPISTPSTRKPVTKEPIITPSTRRPVTKEPVGTLSTRSPVTTAAIPSVSSNLPNVVLKVTTQKPENTSLLSVSIISTTEKVQLSSTNKSSTVAATTEKPTKATKAPTKISSKPTKTSSKPTKSTATTTRKPDLTPTKGQLTSKPTKKTTSSSKPTKKISTTGSKVTTPKSTTTTEKLITKKPLNVTTSQYSSSTPSKISSTTEGIKNTSTSLSTKSPLSQIDITTSNPTDLAKINASQIFETVNGNSATNEIEGVSKPTTNKPGLITWTVGDNRNASTAAPEISSITTEDWVPITTPDGWVLLPNVGSNLTDPAVSSQESTSSSPSMSPTNATTPSMITQSSSVDVPLVEINATVDMVISSSSSTSSYVTGENEVSSSSEASSVVTLSVNPLQPSTETIERPVNMSDFTDVCGRRMYPEARIVGGEKSSFGKWPWQISLRQWRTSTYLHKCGAALLNENWAITAAHCVDNVPPSDLLLRLGEHDLSTESEPYLHQERRVQIVASHPQFDPRTFEYDLALLRFYEPVNFQPNILPVCVPQTDENFVGRTAHVTGWGRLYEDGPLPSILQEVSVPVINNTVCESMYRAAGYIEHIPHIFICAGWRRGGFDSCEGDSGGPMVIQRQDKRFLLAGVISWGIGCAEPNQPGVYTRISEFRDWINQILQF